MKPQEVMDLTSQLKHFGLLNSGFIEEAYKSLSDKAKDMTTPELVLFIMIYTSSDF